MSDASSPWRFLTALSGESEADRRLISLTRADELQTITDMVASSRASILYAASGNGKSSILSAGIVPFFRQRGYAVYRTRPRPPDCTSNPCEAFKRAVTDDFRRPLFSADDLARLQDAVIRGRETATSAEPSEADLLSKIQELATFAPSAKERLTEYAKGSLKEFVVGMQKLLPSGTPILFICDQFEELFVHFTNRPELTEFAKELGEVWADSNLNVRLLFSMREDWVGSMIEFRRTIPNIFSSYFKLAPLKHSHAHHALEQPLKDAGSDFIFSPKALSAILDELADSYNAARTEGTWGMFASSASGQEAFIELPALQIVADELWATRESHPRPFSLEHYRALPQYIQNGGPRAVPPLLTAPNTVEKSSVVDLVLRGYLEKHLVDGGETDLGRYRWLRELRLDCLYLLTDGMRHRRAMPEKRLLEQLNHLRCGGGEANNISLEEMRSALQKLRKTRIILDAPAPVPESEPQLELAHDFAVRAVVLKWREVEHSRLGALAVRAEQQKLREQFLATLEKLQRQVSRYASYLPAVSLFGCCAWTYMLKTYSFSYAYNRSAEFFFLSSLAGPLSFGSAAACLTIGTLQQDRMFKVASWVLFVGNVWLAIVCGAIVRYGEEVGAVIAVWSNIILALTVSWMLNKRFRAQTGDAGLFPGNSFRRRIEKAFGRWGCWLATLLATWFAVKLVWPSLLRFSPGE